MNKPTVLYLHHAKDFSSNPVYLSDDFLLANRSLFGAQEMDSWAGYRILTRDFLVYRLQISMNLSAIQLSLPNGNSLSPIEISMPTGFRAKMNREYIKSLIKYLDPSFAIFSDSALRESIAKIVNDFSISLIWSDTQFYDSLIPLNTQALIRSVNFEPLHVLREDPSLLRFLRFAGKIWSERKICKERQVVAISPRDASLYDRLTEYKMPHLPLRQLSFLLEQSEMWDKTSEIVDKPFFYFAGSTFDVKHNRDNLFFLLHKVAPSLQDLNPDIQLLIFGHRFPKDLKLPRNVQYMHFRDDFYKIINSACGSIVPNRGGAGMQSKIFEPLCIGIPLIANSKALSGYPFDADTHFWKGDSASDIIESINEIMTKNDQAKLKAVAAKSLTHSLFSLDKVQSKVKELVQIHY
jgi:hypothetical protein